MLSPELLRVRVCCACVKEKVLPEINYLTRFSCIVKKQAEPHFLDYDLFYEMLIKCFPKISLILIK